MDRRDGSSSSAKKDDDISTGFRSMILTLEEGDVFQVTLCATQNEHLQTQHNKKINNQYLNYRRKRNIFATNHRKQLSSPRNNTNHPISAVESNNTIPAGVSPRYCEKIKKNNRSNAQTTEIIVILHETAAAVIIPTPTTIPLPIPLQQLWSCSKLEAGRKTLISQPHLS